MTAAAIISSTLSLVRALTLRWLFTRPQALRVVGRLVWLYQASGLESLVRRLKLTALLSPRLRGLGAQLSISSR